MKNQRISTHIGRIDLFLNPNDVPETHLELNGQKVLSSEYPELLERLIQQPIMYPGFSVEGAVIKLPDWREHYLKHGSDRLGLKQPDTMRRVLGKSFNVAVYGQPNSSGALQFEKTRTVELGSGGSTGNTVTFNSAFGIEGQEGTESPNVGKITEPQHIGVLFTVYARKGEGDFDNLIFKDIKDFQESDSLENEFFLTSSGKKVSLEFLLNTLHSKTLLSKNGGS